jgi:hypothetical protein
MCVPITTKKLLMLKLFSPLEYFKVGPLEGAVIMIGAIIREE